MLDITQIVLGCDIYGAIDFWRRRLRLENGEPEDLFEMEKRRERQVVQGAYRTWRREAEGMVPKPTVDNISRFDDVWEEKDEIDRSYSGVSTKAELKGYVSALSDWLGRVKQVVGDEE